MPQPDGHSRTIDNGAGEQLTFLGIRSDERGEYLEARKSVSLGSGPPVSRPRPGGAARD